MFHGLIVYQYSTAILVCHLGLVLLILLIGLAKEPLHSEEGIVCGVYLLRSLDQPFSTQVPVHL
ncbi:MAG: hypothetical protein ABSC55_28235 [Syntrophorhabdales bacterium]